MTNVIDEKVWFYDHQLERYTLQFMAIFSNMYVQFGKKNDRDEGLVPVHLTYGSKDRVVAWIFGDQTQNKPLRLPAMAANLTNIDLAPDRAKGTQTSRRDTYLPNQGILPDDIRTVEQRMPIPYNLTMDLSIYTTNYDEHYQILEQILVLFDPSLSIQTSTDSFDWTKIHTVDLVAVNSELNYPSGGERRMIQTTLTFSCKVWLSLPAKIRKDFIKTIQLRVGAVNTATQGSSNILAELDANGYDYNTLFDFDEDVDLT